MILLVLPIGLAVMVVYFACVAAGRADDVISKNA